ncbi:MAG: Gfo/Idh/MocA family oxidoreductase [Planctomycetaceae bacterium]|nr:Gfo/Idh/MocA family oxidoreductase [Planctomycetaceae bacterium]
MCPMKLTRRQFVASSLAAGVYVAGSAAPVWSESPNDKMNVAFIGCGGRGGANLKTVSGAGGVNVVTLCDVNGSNLARASELFPQAKTFEDFREVFDYPDDFDAVVVSTCEHTHAYATMPALRAGKHVYCEKPLTHNVAESRLVMNTAAEKKVATQMGTQIHGMPNYRRVVELVRSGAIGKITEAHVWVSRAWGLQSAEAAKRNGDIIHVTDRPAQGEPVPNGLNWDLWLGPAKERPFHSAYFPGPKWYRWWEFGNGTMSDLGSHWNDLPFWALELDAPLAITPIGDQKPHEEIAPATMTAEYEYGKRGDADHLGALKLTWYQGEDKPERWKNKEIPQWGNGVLFVGDKGMILSDYGKHVLLPEEKFMDFERPPQTIPDSPGQHEEWLIACRTGAPTGSPFSYAGLLTEANHLGNVAFRAGQRIEWNHADMKIPNCPDAERFLAREPRKGWSL